MAVLPNLLTMHGEDILHEEFEYLLGLFGNAIRNCRVPQRNIDIDQNPRVAIRNISKRPIDFPVANNCRLSMLSYS